MWEPTAAHHAAEEYARVIASTVGVTRHERVYAAGSKWMMHEAFCLHSQAELYKPYEKNHSTVMDSCRLAEELKVRNLILYHTEDDNLAHRKELYTAEGKKYYSGNLLVPDDLETIEL